MHPYMFDIVMTAFFFTTLALSLVQRSPAYAEVR